MPILTYPARLMRRFSKDKRGNVFMLMGFAIIPITIAAGMTVDYTRAARTKTELDAAADAAALSAVVDGAKAANDKTVCERAAALFDAQARTIPDIGYNRATSLSVSVGGPALLNNSVYNGATNTCSSPAAGNPPSHAANRRVSISYTVNSNNYFSRLLNRASLPVTGRAGTESATAPDIDFYVALDTSPSMALPVTTAGITRMASTLGCTFACHTNNAANTIKDNATFSLNKEAAGRTGMVGSNPVVYIDADNTYVYKNGKKNCNPTCTTDINVYNADGSYVDTYWWALNQNIALRVTELRRATADLVTTALTQAADNGATYRAAIYAFDYQENFRTIQPLVTIAEAFPSMATIAAGNAFRAKATSRDIELAMLDDKTGNGCPATNCRSDNRYLFTSFKGLLDGVVQTGYLPAVSGNGTRAAGDTPQAILFIVTDGMSDEKASIVSGINSGGDRTRSELSGLLPNPGTNTHLKKCQAIKNRGIRIAILYTEYTAASIASDEPGQRGIVTARIPYVEPRLIDCASPGLMLKVSTDGDISGALTALFLKATTAARLVK